MRFSDIARSCTQNLLRRKSRTILTVLGVIVGCCSIVAHDFIGQGINEQNEQMLKNMGNLNDMTVYADGGGSYSTATSSSVRGSGGEQAKLDDDAVQNFRSIAGVAGVLPQKTMSYSVDAAKELAPGTCRNMSTWWVDAHQLENPAINWPADVFRCVPAKCWRANPSCIRSTTSMRQIRAIIGIEAGDYYCDENDCVQSEGEDPFFDMLNSKITLITGANYQSPDDYRKVGGGSVASSDSGSGESPTITMPYTVVGVIDSSANNYDAFTSGIVMSIDDMKNVERQNIGGHQGQHVEQGRLRSGTGTPRHQRRCRR